MIDANHALDTASLMLAVKRQHYALTNAGLKRSIPYRTRRYLTPALILALVLTINACTEIRTLKLLRPEWFGMEEIATDVFVDAEMDSTARVQLPSRIAVASGKDFDEAFYEVSGYSPSSILL